MSTLGRGRQLLKEHGLWLTAVLTVSVFFGLFLYSDRTKAVAALERFPPERFLAMLGLTTVSYGFRWAKWEYYLRELDVSVPLSTSMITFFSGLMMVVTPGKAGEVWKAWFLHDLEGISVNITTSVVGAERITDLLGLSTLAMVGILVYSYSSITLLAVGGCLVGGVILLQWRSFCIRVIGVCRSLPLVGGYASEIEEFYESTYTLFQLGPLSVAFVLSIIAWGLEGIALWVALGGLGLNPSLLVAAFVFGLGSIVGAASMLPGGLVATEASMVGLLVSFGYGKTTATVATILSRVATLWYAVILGSTVFLTYKMRR